MIDVVLYLGIPLLFSVKYEVCTFHSENTNIVPPLTFRLLRRCRPCVGRSSYVCSCSVVATYMHLNSKNMK